MSTSPVSSMCIVVMAVSTSPVLKTHRTLRPKARGAASKTVAPVAGPRQGSDRQCRHGRAVERQGCPPRPEVAADELKDKGFTLPLRGHQIATGAAVQTRSVCVT